MMAREHVTRQGPVAGSLDTLGHDVSCLCDPDILTLGFARRFTEYKRCNLLLHDMARAESILCTEGRKVQLVMAGKAHPADAQGKAMIRQWTEFIGRCNVRPHVVFLVDYDMAIAEHLVHGVDVWLNTPRRPWEASGTSGMKVLANGGLNLSELDGWWAEAYAPEVGWAIGDGQEHDSDPAWDAAEAEQLYDLLENEVIPEFYDRDGRASRAAGWPGSARAWPGWRPCFPPVAWCSDYVDGFYLPASAAYAQRSANGAAVAEDIVRWREALDDEWQRRGLCRLPGYARGCAGRRQQLLSAPRCGWGLCRRARFVWNSTPNRSPAAIPPWRVPDSPPIAADSGAPEVHRLSLASPPSGTDDRSPTSTPMRPRSPRPGLWRTTRPV